MDVPEATPNEQRLLTAEEVAAWLQVAVVTVKLWTKQGRFPEPIKIAGGPVVRWQVSTIQEWLDEQCPPSTRPGGGVAAAGEAEQERTM